MGRILGWILFALGAWMLVSPQARTGLDQLEWMADHAFPGEVVLGIALLTAALHLIDIKPRKRSGRAGH